MLASSLREEAQATVSNKPGHRGEREVSRKTIARGMPGDFRCTCGDYTRVLTTTAHEAAGALGTRHSLRPLIYWANGFCKASGDQRREIAESYFEIGLPSLRAKRSNPSRRAKEEWIASSLRSSQ
jgi:hypothetical protein